MLATMHKEDVKAAIRKRYGTVAEFERQKGLPAKSVAEILRGRSWRVVTEAVEAALQEDEPSGSQYEHSDNSERARAHRLNAEVR